MTENQEQHCPSCAAVIRPKAVFCHRCGKTLIDGEVVRETQNLAAIAPEIEKTSAVSLEKTDSLAPPEIESKEIESETVIAQLPIEPATDLPPENGVVAENAAVENKIDDAPKLQKKRQKQRYVKQTEYVWEDANAPTWRVLLFALVALGVVSLLLWFGNFLK